MKELKHFILVGAPASGKGTQGRFLADTFGLHSLSTGSLLRREVESCTELGRKALSYMDRAMLVPDEIVNDMVRGWLSEMDHGAWLLDGYPRTVAQAETLDHFLNQRGTSVDVVVWMDVSRELIEQRIMRRRECSTCGYVVQTPEEECSKCGGKMVSRKDDNMEAFARRWKDFEAMTLPAARYYEARGLVVKMTVSEEREPAEVSRDLARKLEEYRQSVEYLELCKQTLEEEEDVLNTAQASLEKEQQAVNTLISEKEQQIVAYQGDISNKEAAIKEYEADISAQNATIAALEKAVAADKAKLEEENRLKYDGGMFQMPCPGYTRISDDYGNRMHPTLKVQKFHNGVDFAAPSGTAILAAYSGNVVAASYNSSMGNYVMIDHGDGLYTIYMHASKLYVSTGQSVSKGATIAAVGSTGRSTGPHLHFSVRSNGSYVSPWNYLK